MDKDKEGQVDNPAEDVTLPEVKETDSIRREDLPTGTVHCFPANPKQILIRRIITGIVALLCIAGGIFFLLPETVNYMFAFLIGVLFVVCALVFIQTFLISGFRVAVDYEQNEVVLRYMFRKLKIPFEEFDCREGEPDQAQKALGKINANRPQRMYLILDNVHDDACYQTSSYDLASVSDFLKLKEEAEHISSIFKARDKFEEEQKALDEQYAADEEDDESEEVEVEATENPVGTTEGSAEKKKTPVIEKSDSGADGKDLKDNKE
ncbi:MAG: hypothetical protein JW780_03120 [Clostridiales bacterium]|nr:hypothetical protein [Clostridiales bacterium]